jgi:hypothetical protein
MIRAYSQDIGLLLRNLLGRLGVAAYEYICFGRSGFMIAIVCNFQLGCYLMSVMVGYKNHGGSLVRNWKA